MLVQTKLIYWIFFIMGPFLFLGDIYRRFFMNMTYLFSNKIKINKKVVSFYSQNNIKEVLSTGIIFSIYNNEEHLWLCRFSSLKHFHIYITRSIFNYKVVSLLYIVIEYYSLWDRCSLLNILFTTEFIFLLKTKLIIIINPQLKYMYEICTSNSGS